MAANGVEHFGWWCLECGWWTESKQGGIWIPKDLLVAQGVVKKGDLIVVTSGSPMGQVGGTNALKIVKVGEFS